MPATTKQLLDMKAKIDAAVVSQAKLEGALTERMTRLNQLGFDTEEAARKHQAKIQAMITRLNEKIESGMVEIEAKYKL